MQQNSNDEVYRVLSSDNLVYGPIALETLAQWVRERRVQPHTWVHSNIGNNWFAAGSMVELETEFDAVATISEATPALSPTGKAITVEELREFERFAPYSNEDLGVLISFCEVVVAAKGDVIIKKGDLSDSLFLILSGQVRARIMVGSSDTSLGTMEPGELFGEVAMLSQTARSADVVAESPTRLLQLTSDFFQELMSTHSPLAAKMLYNLARLLAARLSQRNAQLQKDLASSFNWR